jgi:hypothetical protein
VNSTEGLSKRIKQPLKVLSISVMRMGKKNH